MEIELRPEVKIFAELMEYRLRRHDDWPGWQGMPYAFLMKRLREEIQELSEALGISNAAIIQEATDVANFAMMIADNATRDR